MRIGLVCPYAWDVPGGVRSHVADLGLTLAERGHQVSVLAPAEDPDLLPDWVVDGGRPVSVPYNGSVAKVTFGWRTTKRIRTWIRDGEFDVLHVHEPVAPGLSLIALWAASGPIVGTWHSSTARSRILSAGYYVAQTAMEKLSGRIAVSEDARRTLVAHVGGDAVLIPNGVRVADYALTDRLAEVDPDRPSMLFLGRIDEPRKGLEVLLDAMPAIIDRVPSVQLIVAGPGDAQDRRSGLDPVVAGHVTFLGRLSDQDKVRALRSVDLYVAPHTGGESFGIVLIEAMAAQAAAMNAVIDALGKAGIASKDIQTSGLSLYPRYDYLEHAQSDGSIRGEQKLAGYVSSNMISARVRRLDTLGATIDSLVEAGGNTFSGVTFALDKDRELKNQARTQAVKEALAKAELYANAAGLRVARIVTISEGYEYSPQPVMMARAEMAMDRAAPTPVAAGEVGVTASVSVLFELVK